MSASVPQPETQKRVGETDNKDFADHLRTVQFTLIAACLGLMVATTAPGNRTLAIAHQQAEDILEIQRQWDSMWLVTLAQSRINEAKSSFAGLDPYLPEPSFINTKAIEVAGHRFNVKLVGRPWVISGLNKSHANGETRAEPFDRPFETGATQQAPKTLAEFRVLWDDLPPVQVNTYPRYLENGKATHYSYNAGNDEVKVELLRWKEIAPSNEYKELVLFIQGPYEADEKGAQGAYEGDWKEGETQMGVRLPIQFYSSLKLDAQGLLIARFPGQFRHGPFAEAFQELDTVTTQYQDVPLAVIEKIIRSELERSKEAFEAFGVRFPVETTARWGILILLGVQMYFWLHLAEYRRRKIVDPPIAWIGSYGNIFARFVFSLTTLAVPIIVVCFVAIRGKLVISPTWLQWGAVSSVALLSGLFALLTALEYFEVRRRRREKERHSPVAASSTR